VYSKDILYTQSVQKEIPNKITQNLAFQLLQLQTQNEIYSPGLLSTKVIAAKAKSHCVVSQTENFSRKEAHK
jgi:hypothetical protein